MKVNNKMYYLKFIIVNLITISRLVGAISLPLVYYFMGSKVVAVASLIIFSTDFIDGKLSRFWKVQTFFGSLMDTICDKLFAMSLLAVLTYMYPVMMIPLIFEILIMLVNTYAYRGNKNVQASKVGKWKAFILDGAIILAFLVLTVPIIEHLLPLNLVMYVYENEITIINVLSGVIIGSQVLALSDYSKKAFSTEFIDQFKGKKYVPFKRIVWMAVNHEFYMKHKNDSLRQFLYKK